MIKIRILDVTSGAQYQRVKYDQWVEVETRHGTLSLFDEQILVDKQDIGKEVAVSVVANAYELNRAESSNVSIDELEQDQAIIRGWLSEVGVDDSDLVGQSGLLELRLGEDTVLVDPPTEWSPEEGTASISKGDFVEVKSSRVDCYKIEPHRSGG